MRFERFKIWQWMILGVLLGTGVGYLWGFYEFEPDFRIAQTEFENSLGEKAPDGQLQLKSLVLHPPVMDANNKPVQRITGLWLRGVTTKDAPGTITNHVYKSFEYYARVDYVPGNPWGRFRNAPRQNAMSPQAYLDGIAKTQSDVTYTLGSEPSQVRAMSIGAGSGFLLIGLIWPLTIKLLIAAGLVPEPKVDNDAYDLSRYGKTPEPAKMPASLKPITTAEDQQRLTDLTAEMERKLADFGANDPATVLIPADQVAADRVDTRSEPIKTLNTTPVEAPSAAVEPGHKDYKGEFYPVVRGKS